MKKYLATVVLAAALVHSASATTFPSLTTIYVASGVEDDDAADNVGTSTVIACSNVSGVPTNLRILVLNSVGAVAGSTTGTGVGHGRTLRFATHPTFLGNEQDLATGGIFGGVINVESLESGVFCTFAVVDAAGPGGAGFPLNAVRVNPHPGTVE